MREAERRSGPWLACRIGCYECCIGPFPITRLDALRLRKGLSELESRDPERAGRIRAHARESAERLKQEFPGDTMALLLDVDEAGENELCPVLDPASGACDLYEARPINCRTFGPAVRFPSASEPAVGVCELCYRGASDEEIAACEVEVDTRREAELLLELDKSGGGTGETLVAFALAEAS